MADKEDQESKGQLGTSAEEFLPELERLTVLRYRLHGYLMTALQYLQAYEDVGVDADDKRSAGMAFHQHSLLSDVTQKAAECIIQLPQTRFMMDLHTTIQMIRQDLERARTQADNAVEDGADDETIIRYIREAISESYQEVAGPLNRMAAELLTCELTSEIRERMEFIEQMTALAQCGSAGTHPESDADQANKIGGPGPSDTTHGPDFRGVKWYGRSYVFTPTQARVVQILWEAMERGTPDVGQDFLCEESGSESSANRLRDVFRDHPAWQAMIVSGEKKGTFRLSLPHKKS